MKENGYGYEYDDYGNNENYKEIRDKVCNLYYRNTEDKKELFDYFLSLDESVQNEWGTINTFFNYFSGGDAWQFLMYLEHKDFDFQKNSKVLEAAIVCCENGYIEERAEYLSGNSFYGEGYEVVDSFSSAFEKYERKHDEWYEEIPELKLEIYEDIEHYVKLHIEEYLEIYDNPKEAEEAVRKKYLELKEEDDKALEEWQLREPKEPDESDELNIDDSIKSKYTYDYLEELSYSDDNSSNITYIFDIIIKNNPEFAKQWAIRVSEIYEPYKSPDFISSIMDLDPKNIRDYISDEFIDKALTQTSPMHMPELIELINKADPQIAKDYFNEINLGLAFKNCKDFEIPNFVKALGEIDSVIRTTFVKDFMSYAFEYCDKEKITNLLDELGHIEYFCTCMEPYERAYFDRDELKEYLKFALDNCPKKQIPNLFCNFNDIDSVYSEEFIKDALINCPNENLSELMDRLFNFSGIDTVKNSINKVFEECKDDDIKLKNILKLFLKNELREEFEIPYKTAFVKELIKDHTEKIEIIDEACPEKIKKQPEINNLISKIKDANANYSNQEEDSKEIKPKQVENIKDDIFVK